MVKKDIARRLRKEAIFGRRGLNIDIRGAERLIGILGRGAKGERSGVRRVFEPLDNRTPFDRFLPGGRLRMGSGSRISSGLGRGAQGSFRGGRLMSEQNPEVNGDLIVNGDFVSDLKLWIDESAEIPPEAIDSLFEEMGRMRQEVRRSCFCDFIGGRQNEDILPWITHQPARNNPPSARPPADWNDKEVRQRIGETYSPMEDEEGRVLRVAPTRLFAGCEIKSQDEELIDFFNTLTANSPAERFGVKVPSYLGKRGFKC